MGYDLEGFVCIWLASKLTLPTVIMVSKTKCGQKLDTLVILVLEYGALWSTMERVVVEG